MFTFHGTYDTLFAGNRKRGEFRVMKVIVFVEDGSENLLSKTIDILDIGPAKQYPFDLKSYGYSNAEIQDTIYITSKDMTTWMLPGLSVEKIADVMAEMDEKSGTGQTVDLRKNVCSYELPDLDKFKDHSRGIRLLVGLTLLLGLVLICSLLLEGERISALLIAGYVLVILIVAYCGNRILQKRKK